MPAELAKKYKRLGKAPKGDGKLYALDIKTGKEQWTAPSVATALAYSELHDNLVQSYSKGTLGKKEKKPAVVLKGSDGSAKFTL